MRNALAEVIKLAEEAPHTDAIIHVLRSNDSAPLRLMLRFALDPDLVWDLPEGAPPYKTQDMRDNVPGALFYEARRLDLFLKGGRGGNLSALRKETLFLQILESCTADDAQMLLDAKDKKVGTSGRIDLQLASEAFPGLFPVREE